MLIMVGIYFRGIISHFKRWLWCPVIESALGGYTWCTATNDYVWVRDGAQP